MRRLFQEMFPSFPINFGNNQPYYMAPYQGDSIFHSHGCANRKSHLQSSVGGYSANIRFVPPKHWQRCTKLHGIKFQATVIWIVTAVRTSDITFWYSVERQSPQPLLYSTETLPVAYHTTRCYVTEDSILQSHRRENLISHIIFLNVWSTGEVDIFFELSIEMYIS
jgi:hypothetical protein